LDVDMGRRITQRIIICDDCGRTPEDGEYIWEMAGEYICENCIDKDEEDKEDNNA
jgi:hypothetical protein